MPAVIHLRLRDGKNLRNNAKEMQKQKAASKKEVPE